MSVVSKFKFLSNLLVKGVVLITFIIVLRKLVPELVETPTIAIIEPATGSLVVRGKHLTEGFLAAVDEINQEGYLGFFKGIKQVRVIRINDNLRDPASLAKVKERLADQKVEAVFGCSDSRCVRLIQPVIDELKLPFFYALPHEGLLDSDNFMHLGPLPNQMIVPAVQWALDNLGERAYVVGSNTLYSRFIGSMITKEVNATGGEITGQTYFGVDSDIGELPEAWRIDETDVVFSVIDNDQNVALIKKLSVDIGVERPKMVFLHEDIGDVSVHNSFEWDGYYLASTYGIDATHNANLFFLKSWKDRVAGSIRAGAFEAAAYSAVKLWFDGRGNLRAGDNRAPLDALQGHSISLPMGEITVGWDAPYINHHLTVYRFDNGGQPKVVWQDSTDRMAIMRPIYQSLEEWTSALEEYEAETRGVWMSNQTLVITTKKDAT